MKPIRPRANDWLRRSAAYLNRSPGVVACILLATHAGLIGYAAVRYSPTIDEVGHLPAGISYWELGTFELYRVNPPLTRLIAALPVVLSDARTDWRHFYSTDRPEWLVGQDFVTLNAPRVFDYFTFARWAGIPVVILGGYICWRWSNELYGGPSSNFTLVLWCFCPLGLTFNALITPDAGACTFGTIAVYCFWKWLRSPSFRSALVAGAAGGVAQLTKTTWVILPVLYVTIWTLHRLTSSPRPRVKTWRSEGGQLAAAGLTGLLVLNLGYAGQGTCLPLGEYRFASRSLRGDAPDAAGARGNRFAGTPWSGIPVPLPKHYVLGIDAQRLDFEGKMLSYLGGQWRLGGWWYYYAYGLGVKLPVGVWALLIVVAIRRTIKRTPGVAVRDEFVLLAPAVTVFAFVSSQTGFNHHLRYVLPTLPLVYVWLGQAARAETPRGKFLVAALALWAVSSSLSVYPHSMAYFNELAGGPSNGYRHLLNSNLDWGQNLHNLKYWIDAHPDARPIHVAYHGSVDPRTVGIDHPPPPFGPTGDSPLTDEEAANLGPVPGWHAISIEHIMDHPHKYSYFLRFTPVERIGYTIYVYRLHPDEVAEARSSLGLAPLRAPSH